MYERVLAYLSFKPDPLVDIEAPEPPGELVLYNDLRRWGQDLPCTGGYFDQPWTLMQDLKTVKTAIQHRQNALDLQADMQTEIDDLAVQARAMAGL
ncbi:MAG: hypothetical protein GWN58_27675 [Anaerolineae bacterium]|nr:hypothetical protein [Anaerolineae bacterium]